MGIKARLLTLVGVSVLFLAGLGIYADRTVNQMKGSVDYLGNERLPKADILGELRAATNAIPRFMWLAHAFPHGSAERKQNIEKAHQYEKMLKQGIEKFQAFNLSEKANVSLKTMLELFPQVVMAVQKAEVEMLSSKGNDSVIKEILIKEMAPPAVKLTSTIVELAAYNQEANKEYVKQATAESETAKNYMRIAAVVSSLLLLLIGYLYSKVLSESLLRITESVANASEQVAAASNQLSLAASQLSSTSQEQASAVEETSASLTEIAGMVQSNTKGAEGANETVRKVYEVSEEAKKSMENLNQVMSGILASNTKIEKLVKVIEEIGEKTEIIDDIVFKTQLLSFNASVEAERAGEHGRGFAVVAQEVGTLAQLSGKAATDISSIVKISIKEAEEVAKENKTKVESGGELAGETRDQVTNVLTQLNSVLETMNRIVAASHEQNQGVSQISTSVDSINQATQQTASTAEEAASASAELSGQSQSLMALVDSLRVIIQGHAGHNGKDAVRTQDFTTKIQSHKTDNATQKNVVSLDRKRKNLNHIKNDVPRANESSSEAWEKL
jgi:methyl-accepting chemotaxis protein